jgi:hypothetical protein
LCPNASTFDLLSHWKLVFHAKSDPTLRKPPKKDKRPHAGTVSLNGFELDVSDSLGARSYYLADSCEGEDFGKERTFESCKML